MVWVWITLGAGLVQTARFVLQKLLSGSGLSAGGATFSRFLFGAPLAVAAVLWTAVFTQRLSGLPPLGPVFWGFVCIGGAAQAAATLLLVRLFKLRNFAVGIAFTKTETVQVALFSMLILGETVAPLGWIGIALGVVGVIFLSRPPQGGAIMSHAAWLGIVAGGLFGLSAICYRGATLELQPLAFFDRAIVTLAATTTVQTLGMSLYLRAREPGELSRVCRAWRRTIWVGVLGVVGSAGWFCAFALQNAAYVRAVGQVEMVFTLFASVLFFHERLTRREGLGIGLVLASLLVIVASGRGAGG
ncbi:DMT family transporter [Rhodobacteraceae bacterium]|nr:DMT family transporter [Paracoccaceae bacterium]